MRMTIDGTTLNYERTGIGPPVLLLHGWGASIQVMKPVARYLAGIGREAVSLDFPGFGESPPPPAAWGVPEYAALTRRFIEELNLEKPDVIAHSFGGRVTIYLAGEDPDLFGKLVLVDAAGIRPKRSLGYYVRVYRYKLGKRLAKNAFFDRAFGLSERMKTAGSADYRALSGVMRESFVRIVNLDLARRLKSIRNETLLVWGEDDRETPLSMARRMQAEIPEAGLAVIPNAGHFSFLDQYARFCSIIKVLLEERR